MFTRQGCEEEGEGCSMAGTWSDTQVPVGKMRALSEGEAARAWERS